jgi:citrate lyase subunit beta/citryl-CoA lyase
MRSKLFVPGSRPELFPKALASQADAISIDLEDSVVLERKSEARDTVADFLQSSAARATAKTLIVRVNALDTPHFEADVMAVVRSGLSLLNLPKVECAADIQAAVAIIERAERSTGVTTAVKILANLETPKGLRNAVQIGFADARVVGLQLGLADLFEPLGIDRRDARHVHATLFALRMAAAEAGVFAYDAAFANVADPDGYRAEAQMAHSLGYLGKSCIHPSQIALANEVFRPSDADIAVAQRILAAMQTEQAQSVGALLVDGKMVDAPFVRRAQQIIEIAKKMGLISHE